MHISFGIFLDAWCIYDYYLTTPALFMSKSIPPNVFSIHWYARFTDSSLVISHSTAFNWPSTPNKLKRNCSTLSLRRAKPHTIIPHFTNSVQIAAPMPLLAPVTTATRPDQRSIFILESFYLSSLSLFSLSFDQQLSLNFNTTLFFSPPLLFTASIFSYFYFPQRITHEANTQQMVFRAGKSILCENKNKTLLAAIIVYYLLFCCAKIALEHNSRTNKGLIDARARLPISTALKDVDHVLDSNI